MSGSLVIGTRKSRLALWQAEHVKARLEALHPGLTITLQHIVTRGDTTQSENKPLPEIGGKGLFTAELEAALREGSIDIAVHSLKDLPTASDPAFTLGAVSAREEPWDILICRNAASLGELPKGAVIGTSSLRRSAQLLRIRPDLVMESIRGNVDTRIAKLRAEDGPYDAIVLAYAGVHQLGRASEITQIFGRDEMLPAPGQGALAVQCRSGDDRIIDLLRPIHDEATYAAVGAERAFLATLEAGCNTPVAAHATVEGDELLFAGRCVSSDGKQCIEVEGRSPRGEFEKLGAAMGREALSRGFRDLT